MTDEPHHFRSLLGQPPARFPGEQPTWTPNCRFHDTSVQVAVRPHEPEERVVLGEESARLDASLHQFQRDFVVAIETILTSAGSVFREEARKWVTEGLHPN